MKKVNIDLGESLHKQAKIISVLKDVRLNEYLREAVESAVSKDKSILKKIN